MDPTQALDYMAIPDVPVKVEEKAHELWGRLVSTNPDYPSIELHEKDVVLGRQSTCDVRIADASISGRHCRLFREAEPGGPRCAYFVEDLSTNGTFVDGVRVGQHNKVSLFLSRTPPSRLPPMFHTPSPKPTHSPSFALVARSRC